MSEVDSILGEDHVSNILKPMEKVQNVYANWEPAIYDRKGMIKGDSWEVQFASK